MSLFDDPWIWGVLTGAKRAFDHLPTWAQRLAGDR